MDSVDGFTRSLSQVISPHPSASAYYIIEFVVMITTMISASSRLPAHPIANSSTTVLTRSRVWPPLFPFPTGGNNGCVWYLRSCARCCTPGLCAISFRNRARESNWDNPGRRTIARFGLATTTIAHHKTRSREGAIGTQTEAEVNAFWFSPE